MANEPVKRISVGNGIHAAIWKNESDKGESWFTVKICRKYKDEEAYKETTSFRRDDLLFVSKAADMAFGWCIINGDANRKNNQE